MSGGEKQRVAAARVLFQKPKIYFADEPASSLDAYYAGRVLGLLRQEADEKANLCFACFIMLSTFSALQTSHSA